MVMIFMEEFEVFLNESFEMDIFDEGIVVKGKIIVIEVGQVIIDVGYKMEGCVDLKEFVNSGEVFEVFVGDEVEVYLCVVENVCGEVVIFCEMVCCEEVWDCLEKVYVDDVCVEGVIFGCVKGGFIVDLGGVVVFFSGF